MNLLKPAIKDYFSFKFLMFSFIPLFTSIALFLLLVLRLFAFIKDLSPDEEAFSFFAGALVFQIVHYLLLLAGALSGLFSLLHGWQFAIIFALFIISFLTPVIIKAINARHYRREILGASFLKTLAKQLLFTLKFLCFLLCALLIYFIPVLNFFAPLLVAAVFFYLYFNFLITDVASNILSDTELAKFNPYQAKYLLPAAIYYAICNIPFAGFFLQVFFVTHLAHLIFYYELGARANEKVDEKQATTPLLG